MKKIFLILSLFLLISTENPASAGSLKNFCFALLNQISSAVRPQTPIEKIAKQKESLGLRGYLTSKIPYSAKNEVEALDNGLAFWGLRFVLLNSYEEVVAHSRLDGNLLMSFVYVVSKSADKNLISKSEESAMAELKRIIKSGDFKIYTPDPSTIDPEKYKEGSRLTKITPEIFQKTAQELGFSNQTTPLTSIQQAKMREALIRLKNEEIANTNPSLSLLEVGDGLKFVEATPGQIRILTDNLEHLETRFDNERADIYANGNLGNPSLFFYLRGLFRKEFQGTIAVEDTLNSSTYKKIFKDMGSALRKGYRITYNYAFEQAIDLLPIQERSSLHVLSGVTIPIHPKSNRFRPELYYGKDGKGGEGSLRKEFLDAYKDGKMGSIEVLDPEGKVVGATIYNRVGNQISPDTVVGEIKFYKFTIAALMDMAKKAGVPFVDAGMVSNMSVVMKAKYVSGKIIEPIFVKLRNQEPTLLVGSGQWTPSN